MGAGGGGEGWQKNTVSSNCPRFSEEETASWPRFEIEAELPNKPKPSGSGVNIFNHHNMLPLTNLNL